MRLEVHGKRLLQQILRHEEAQKGLVGGCLNLDPLLLLLLLLSDTIPILNTSILLTCIAVHNHHI